MKTLFKTLAVAALVALPAAADAQIDNNVDVNILSHPRATTATGYGSSLRGGGFLADFTVDFPTTTTTFTNYLVWCIDPTRSTTVPSTFNYSLYSLSGFAASGLGTVTNDPTLADMQEIASITQDLEDNWGLLTANERQLRQGQTWDKFTGNNLSPYAGDPAFDGSSWYVLFSNQNKQTFLTRIPERSTVPEPSSIALLGVGLVGLVAARRRRLS